MARVRIILIIGASLFVISGVSFVLFRIGNAKAQSASGALTKDRCRRNKQMMSLRQAIARQLKKQESSREYGEENRRIVFNRAVSEITGDSSAVVIEMDNIIKSPVGKIILACLDKEKIDERKRVERELGIDVLADANRIAVADHFVLVQGNVAHAADGKAVAGLQRTQHGENGTLMTRPISDDSRPNAGLWKDELLVFSDDVDEIRETMDVYEGCISCEYQPERFIDRRGSFYGDLGLGELLNIMDAEHSNDSVIKILREHVSHISFDVDTASDVVAKVKLETNSIPSASVLVSSLEALLAGKKVKRAFNVDDIIRTDIVESVDIDREATIVSVEFVIPLALLKKAVADCIGSD